MAMLAFGLDGLEPAASVAASADRMMQMARFCWSAASERRKGSMAVRRHPFGGPLSTGNDPLVQGQVMIGRFDEIRTWSGFEALAVPRSATGMAGLLGQPRGHQACLLGCRGGE